MLFPMVLNLLPVLVLVKTRDSSGNPVFGNRNAFEERYMILTAMVIIRRITPPDGRKQLKRRK